MKKTVSIFLGALASSAIFLAGCAAGGEARDDEALADSVSAALDDGADPVHSINVALRGIFSRAEERDTCIAAIQAQDVDKVRELLRRNGGDAAYVETLPIDLSGSDADSDEPVEGTLALDVKYVQSDPGLPPEPVGIVKIGCCWVDWNAWLNGYFPWV